MRHVPKHLDVICLCSKTMQVADISRCFKSIKQTVEYSDDQLNLTVYISIEYHSTINYNDRKNIYNGQSELLIFYKN